LRGTFACALVLAGTASISAQTSAPAQPGTLAQRAEVRAARTATPPLIDGRLIEECWSTAQPASRFIQRDPDEGRPATEHTELLVLYDDRALYIAARLRDSEPALVARGMAARDALRDADADRITIYLDAMHDGLTGAAFEVSASNVQRDMSLSNDTFRDDSWDAVWESQVAFDANGWSVEIRIPLSQLRFTGADVQTWGINVERFIRRKNEYAWLEMVPKSESGVVSRMATLTGLENIRPTRHLALLPYIAGRAEFVAPDSVDNPFNDGSRAGTAVGLDVKWGVSSNLTLDATVNPDFGQVEVDPAVVNLTAFETFFQEKRAFFLEGAQIFSSFGTGGSNSFWGFNSSDPQVFYSRRIGRSPQVSAEGDYVDAPAATTILGAAKITGKTSSGWSIGLLEAVTEPEQARVRIATLAERPTVEPLTNYTVARVHRDMGRAGGVGMIATSVVRRLDTDTLRDALTSDAHVVGLDAHTFFDDRRDWVVTGKISRSYVRGTPLAIDELQRASQRYFQRPDAPQVALDPGRTSLSGWAGRVNLNRNGGDRQVNAALWGVSPGFEANDVGFHGTGDRAGAHAVFLWRGNVPGRLTRSRSIWVAKSYVWNFNRELQDDGLHANASVTFHNYWNLNGGGNIARRTQDDRFTRGGPSAINPGGHFWRVALNTDERKPFSVRMNANRFSDESGTATSNVGISASLRPSSMVTLSTGPEWNVVRRSAQYVDTVEDAAAVETFGSHYVFGELDQKQLTMTTRLAVVLAPTLSIRLYAQPLIAKGDYFEFKALARPRTFNFDPYDASSLDDPDFSLSSMRVNAVLRWEVKPGSAFYVVWTRSQEDESNPGSFSLRRDARQLLSAPGDDVVMVKLAYWIGR
jgi:hypothetical protein